MYSYFIEVTLTSLK